MIEPILTVFTPTYNRAHCLEKCYESLKRQSIKTFIWMIIDDGSTDNTRDLVETWLNEKNDFKIEYVYKENGGLHTGYNEAIKRANTELMVCIDSDDYMPDDAVETIVNFWETNGGENYAGIVALDVYENGQTIGDKFPDIHDINLIDVLIGKYHFVNGDRKNVVRTELYKKVAPMPSFDGEKNFNPHYMHLQISKEYNFLVLNKPLCVVEYQPDGMTNSIFKQYYNSPKSFAQIRRLHMSFEKAPVSFVFRQCIHYVSSCKLAKSKHIIATSPKPFLTMLAYPFGILLMRYIIYKGK